MNTTAEFVNASRLLQLEGGVCKSTTASNLAAIATQEKKRVLLVDLYTHGNSKHYLLSRSGKEFFS